MWVFLDGHKYDFAPETTNYMTYDGSVFWVSLSNSKLAKVRYFGQDSTKVVTLDLIDEFPNGIGYVIDGHDVLFIFNPTTAPEYFIIMDKTTNEVIDRKDIPYISLIERNEVPYSAGSTPEYGNFRLWFATAKYMFFYNYLTDSWSDLISLPGKRQTTPRKILWAYNSYIYITALNEAGLIKVDDTTGNPVQIITVNRKPLAMHCNNDREIIVASYKGMVSKVDPDTNDVTHLTTTYQEASDIVDTGTYVWAVTPKMTRITKGTTTDNIRIMDGTVKDFSFAAFTDTDFKRIILTRPYQHEQWNNETETIETVTEPQRVAVLANDKLFIAYNLYDSWDLQETRDYYLNVKATSIIAVGEDKYFGEAS